MLVVTTNTVIDATKYSVEVDYNFPILELFIIKNNNLFAIVMIIYLHLPF